MRFSVTLNESKRSKSCIRIIMNVYYSIESIHVTPFTKEYWNHINFNLTLKQGSYHFHPYVKSDALELPPGEYETEVHILTYVGSNRRIYHNLQVYDLVPHDDNF
uniref:DUF2141 domain-containing protein n=1 Tax=Schistosoma curassoni TaxID=6186 RepID=A0A183JM66_9TREM